MRLPVSSAAWMANSATSVLPAPVGAETITDCPAAMARHASIWKSSRGNGSRATTIVEGRVRDADMAEFVLIEMRGRQQIAFGGFFADGETLAICKTPDADTALGWFAESGFWAAERLRARPLLWVL